MDDPRKVGQHFDLRHVHVLTFAGLPGPVDSGEHPDQAEHAGDRVSGRTAPQHWFAVGIARKVREPRGLLSRVCEANVSPARAQSIQTPGARSSPAAG